MQIKKLPNGNLLVPCRLEDESGVIGDGVKEVSPGSVEYEQWIKYLKGLEENQTC